LVGASGAAAVAVLSLQPALAEDIKQQQQPVCVIGCNGKTGTEVVKYLVAKNMPVRATSRTGDYNDAESIPTKAAFEKMACDVTDPSTVKLACAGTKAVIFAASASKQGGTPSSVDNAGLVNVAKACIEANVPHLVVVSSGAVTKPTSPVYQFLNLFGKIMEEKIKGKMQFVNCMLRTIQTYHTQLFDPGG
jgi:nucleoside-diphosphate-sugar epimerase